LGLELLFLPFKLISLNPVLLQFKLKLLEVPRHLVVLSFEVADLVLEVLELEIVVALNDVDLAAQVSDFNLKCVIVPVSVVVVSRELVHLLLVLLDHVGLLLHLELGLFLLMRCVGQKLVDCIDELKPVIGMVLFMFLFLNEVHKHVLKEFLRRIPLFL